MKKQLYHSVLIATLAIFGLSNSINAQTIAGGSSHSISLCNNNTIQVWGDGWRGQLGHGINTGSYIPIQVNSLTGVVSVAAGREHSLVLKNDGTVWAFGYNSDGQLGNGSYVNSNVPVQVISLTGIIAISAGDYDYSLALKNDGTVWAWGRNAYGQLGNGTNTKSNVPVQVSTLAGIIAIAGATEHSLALKNDGTVWAWGDNEEGQLGNGTINITGTYNPVQVSTLTDVIGIAGGAEHSIALKNDGTVWAWGGNLYGELGIGTISQRSKVPVQVTTPGNITAIAAGKSHSLALRNDGTVWSWGYNQDGPLGVGTTPYNNIPLHITSLSNIIAIEAGEYFSFALKSNGTLLTWGQNDFGQLGNGTNTESRIPVQVTGLCNVSLGFEENLIENLISVYPNPSNDIITIENKNDKLSSTYIIFNALGQQILTGKLMGEATTVNISLLQSGIYLLQVGAEEKRSFKLIKK